MAISAALLSCNGNDEKQRQSLMEISKQELATALEERDQLLGLVKEVSAGLEQIKQLENMMTISASHPAENARRQKQMLDDIARLKERIQMRKARLSEIESKLEKSTINNKELHETIHALRMQMDAQIEEVESLRQQLIAANLHIGSLNNTVDSLNSTVSAVTIERNAAQETSMKLENELNACYYIAGTRSELKKLNILESGFLRKTKVMNRDFDKSCFAAADKRILKTLPVSARKIKILTNHPETSYEIIEKNGRKAIRITNPDQFWSLTNYLVIQKD